MEEKDDELVSNILRVPIGSKASCKADHSIWYALRMDMLDSNPRAKGRYGQIPFLLSEWTNPDGSRQLTSASSLIHLYHSFAFLLYLFIFLFFVVTCRAARVGKYFIIFTTANSISTVIWQLTRTIFKTIDVIKYKLHRNGNGYDTDFFFFNENRDGIKVGVCKEKNN